MLGYVRASFIFRGRTGAIGRVAPCAQSRSVPCMHVRMHAGVERPQPQPRAEQAPPPAMAQRKAAERRVARETEVSCLRSS